MSSRCRPKGCRDAFERCRDAAKGFHVATQDHYCADVLAENVADDFRTAVQLLTNRSIKRCSRLMFSANCVPYMTANCDEHDSCQVKYLARANSGTRGCLYESRLHVHGEAPSRNRAVPSGNATAKRNARRVGEILAAAGPNASRLTATAVYDQLAFDQDYPAPAYIYSAKRHWDAANARLPLARHELKEWCSARYLELKENWHGVLCEPRERNASLKILLITSPRTRRNLPDLSVTM